MTHPAPCTLGWTPLRTFLMKLSLLRLLSRKRRKDMFRFGSILFIKQCQSTQETQNMSWGRKKGKRELVSQRLQMKKVEKSNLSESESPICWFWHKTTKGSEGTMALGIQFRATWQLAHQGNPAESGLARTFGTGRLHIFMIEDLLFFPWLESHN